MNYEDFIKENAESNNHMQMRIDDSIQKVVDEVLRKHLEREPTIEDYKDCTRVTHIHQDYWGFELAYKGERLGRISLHMPDFKETLMLGTELKIKFQP